MLRMLSLKNVTEIILSSFLMSPFQFAKSKAGNRASPKQDKHPRKPMKCPLKQAEIPGKRKEIVRKPGKHNTEGIITIIWKFKFPKRNNIMRK